MSLVLELSKIPTGIDGAKEFEKFCEREIIGNYLDEYLHNGLPQKSTNDSQRRFDYVASIKSPWSNQYQLSSPWDIFLMNFNSRCIVFEFKNSAKPIGRTQVLLTSKYLSTNARRSVGIIIARSGFDNNAYQESDSILREYGKLIILIDANELVYEIDNVPNDKGGVQMSAFLATEVSKLLYGPNQ